MKSRDIGWARENGGIGCIGCWKKELDIGWNIMQTINISEDLW